MVHTFHPSTQEAEAEQSQSSRSTWSTQQILQQTEHRGPSMCVHVVSSYGKQESYRNEGQNVLNTLKLNHLVVISSISTKYEILYLLRAY